MASKSDFKLLTRLIGLALKYKSLFYMSLCLTIVLAPLGAIKPYLINIGVDNYILHGQMDKLWNLCLIVFGLILIESVLRFVFSYITDKMGHYVTYDMRMSIFRKVLGMRVTQFDQTPVGILNTRIINDIESIKTVFSEGLLTIVADFIAIVVILAVMFVTSWQLTLVCIIVMPLLIVATIIFNRKVKVSYQKVRTQLANMNAFLQEHISGMNIVQSFNAEKREASKFRSINRSYTRANLDSVLYYAIFFPVVDIISAAALGLMVWWGASGVMTGTVSMGAMIAFPIYLNTLFRPIRMLADKFNAMQMGIVAAERVFKLEDDMSVNDDSATKVLEKVRGDIKFHNLSFEYVSGTPVLNDISLHVPAGKTLAIVGSTGSGKSTIINLLIRFYEYTKGLITIDDIDLKTINKQSLRSHFSLVLQDAFLFKGTIRENITINNPNIDDDTIIKAAKNLDVHRFIMKLPGGYDFNVSERGNNLSSGQRQLISLTRALVYNPSILILDEATASIDTETEEILQYAVEKLLENRTAIIIAHRLSTIRHTDQIIVLEKGQIVERGTHIELLNDPESRYSALYNIQFEGDVAVGE